MQSRENDSDMFVTIVMLALCSDLVAFWLAFGYGGWGLFNGGIIFLVVWVPHAFAHARCAKRITKWTAATILAFISSDLLLVGAFLAQRSPGGSRAWLCFNLVVGMKNAYYVPHWYTPQLAFFTFVLVFASWVCIWLIARQRLAWAPVAAVAINTTLCLALGTLLLAVVLDTQKNEQALMKNLGLPPANCGPIPMPLTNSPFQNDSRPLVGATPLLWYPPQIKENRVLIYLRGNPDVAERLRHSASDPQGPIVIYASWLVVGNVQGRINVRLIEESTGKEMPVWIHQSHSGTPDGVIDPADSTVIRGSYRRFTGRFHVSGSGCYAMEASWPEGKWRIPFAVGW
jgi:hypothetical protein